MAINEFDVESLKKPGFEENLTKHIGYKPNDWQKKVREEKSRFKVICVGRRGGKSYYTVYDTNEGLVTDLLLPNQYVWIVAPNYDLTQRVWSELYTLAINKFKPILQRVHNSKGNFKIETVFGTVIEAKSADEPEKLVGVGLTKIIVDEAALMKQKAWTQSLRPTLMDNKGKAIFISTPKGKNWFWELYQKGQSANPDWKSYTFTSYDNNYLDKKEIDEIVKDMPEFEYRQEVLATFEETAEQLFRNIKDRADDWVARYGTPVMKEPPYEFIPPQKGHRYQIGIDLGRKSSYTVITVVDESEYPYPVVYWDRFKTVDWNIQKARMKEIWNKYRCLRVTLDTTGIGDPVAEQLERDGIRLEPFVYREVTKKQLIDKLAIYMQEGRILYPPIKQLLVEMETFGREISKETGRIKYKAMGSNPDDTVNSLALACWQLIDRARKPRDEDKTTAYQPISQITGY